MMTERGRNWRGWEVVKEPWGVKFGGDCKQGLLNEKLILFLILLEY